jgi:hypothetical protein
MKTRRRHRGLYACLIVIAVFAASCNKNDDSNDLPGPGGPPRALNIRIDGPSQVTQLQQVTFKVVQTWSDGSHRDVTAAATVISSNPSVLSISAGLGMALAAGEVGLTARFESFISQRKTVSVVPTTAEWAGEYRLTVGGGACSSSLPPELRQRTFTATVTQIGLGVTVAVRSASSSLGWFPGVISNPEARFYLTRNFRALKRGGIRPAVARLDEARSRLALRQFSYRRAAYWEPPDTSITEPLPDGNRLVIAGEAVTTISPSGFAGTLNGVLTLYERTTQTQLAVCSSPSHAFVLARS